VTRVTLRIGQIVFVSDGPRDLSTISVVPSRLGATVLLPAPALLVSVGASQTIYAELNTRQAQLKAVSLAVEVQSKRRVSSSSTKLAILDAAALPLLVNGAASDWLAACKRGRIELAHNSGEDVPLPLDSLLSIPLSVLPKSAQPCTRTLRLHWTLTKVSGELYRRESKRTVTFNAPLDITVQMPREGVLADAVLVGVLVKSLVDVPLTLVSAQLRVGSEQPQLRSVAQPLAAGATSSYAFRVARSGACDAEVVVTFDGPDGLRRSFAAPSAFSLPAYQVAPVTTAVTMQTAGATPVGDTVTLRVELRQAVASQQAKSVLVQINAPPQTWIVCGWRSRQHVVPADGSACTLELPCVPLVAGRLAMPTVSVDGHEHCGGIVAVAARQQTSLTAHRP
jgi:hypothetical protein